MAGSGTLFPVISFEWSPMEGNLLIIFSNLIILTAVLLLAYAGYTDIRAFRIPNSVCAAVAVLGLFKLLLFWSLGDMTTPAALQTISAAGIILLVGLLSFALGLIGGGDAKLISATVLLIGSHDFLPFMVTMSILGAVFAIALQAFKHSPLPSSLGPKFAVFTIDSDTKTMVPYGVAIGVAGSATILPQLQFGTVTLSF
jgi:prepilin peptidase CpaA